MYAFKRSFPRGKPAGSGQTLPRIYKSLSNQGHSSSGFSPAAGLAREVYACEPVGTLREYLRDRSRREGIANLRVVDGMAGSLPYPDQLFDIVMSGHVVGDDYDGELSELTRVTKSGGWLIDCPGEETHRAPNQELLRRGWELLPYSSALGGQVYRYRKLVTR